MIIVYSPAHILNEETTMSEHLGFIGVGRMGGPMAGRLLDAGHKLAIFDTNQAAMAPLVGRGAVAAGSVRELAAAVETVIVSLPTPDIVRDVALGENGAPGKRFLDCQRQKAPNCL